MSEELAEDRLQYWRDDVAKRSEEWLRQYPNAKRRPEIREPEKCAQALYLLAETDTKHYLIAEKVGLTEREVGQLTYRRPELWEKRRPELAQKMAAASEQLLDVLEEKMQRLQADPDKLDDEKLKDIALAIGIVTDKAANLNGMATSVVEHRSGPSIEDAMKFREEVRQRVQMAKGKVIDV